MLFGVSRRMWDVVDTPSVSPSGAIIGLCDIEGKAASPISPQGSSLPIMTSPISALPCVWYNVNVEEYAATANDERAWKVRYSQSSEGGFRIADEYGSIAVDPKKSTTDLPKPIDKNESAEVVARARAYFEIKGNPLENGLSTQWVASPDGYYMWHPTLGQWIPTRYVSPDRKQYYDWAKRQWIPLAKSNKIIAALTSGFGILNSQWVNSQLRVTETVVAPGSYVYAHGYVCVTPDGMDLSVGSKSSVSFDGILSSKGQDAVLKKMRITKWTALIIGAIFTLISVSMIFGAVSVNSQTGDTYFSLKRSLVELAVTIVTLLFGIVLLKIFRTYNRFVRLREQVRLSRSAIDITLKRRAALIPELCDVIVGIMQHENSVLESVAQMRSENADQASKQIMALAENYPTIHSSENFIHLQNELGRTEEKIAMARSFLNDSILAMDNLRATFTGIIMSPLFPKEMRPNE